MLFRSGGEQAFQHDTQVFERLEDIKEKEPIVAVFYTLVIGFFVYKELTLQALMSSLKTTSWLTGRVLIIIFTRP